MSHIATSELIPAQQSDPLECYDEPIHIPGYIQPQGILLVLREPDFTLVQVSGNTADFIEIEPHDLLGKNLATILDSQQIDYLRNCLSCTNLQDDNPLEISLQTKKGRFPAFDSRIYHADSVLILEMEPSASLDHIRFSSIYQLIKTSVSRFQSALSLQALCQITVEELRLLTGFDRVMMYRFGEEWHGTVIAEDRVENIDSFLGLHFPAADIPERARQLFSLNKVRLIEDVNSVPVPIIPANNPITGTPLDLSLSSLRSVSPIHIEYLQNMGVDASIALALTKNGKLWGLIACHHRSPKRVPHEIRTACRFISQVLSLELAAKEDLGDSEYRMELKFAQAKFIEYMSQEENFTDGLVKYKPNLLDPIDAKGVALYFNGQCTLLGETPRAVEVKRLVNWLLDHHSHDEVFCTDSLPRLYKEAEGFKHVASGLLAVLISKEQKNYILWFRPEVIQTVKWGGDPNQTIEMEEGSLRLHPRKSFALWKETVRLKSLPWKQCEIDAAIDLRSSIIVIMVRRANELAKLNIEMKHALDRERELSELKSNFVTMTSHEFRTPLSAILSSAELLQKYSQKLSEEQKFTHLRQIQRSVRHLTQLLNDVLLIGKAEAGKLEFNPALLDLVQFCHDLVKEMQLTTDSHTIIFCSQGQCTNACMDEKLLRHILSNLLSNAIKYSPQGSTVHFDLTCERGEANFYVRDEGIGIPVADQAKLFDSFHRASNVGNISGTGLGLSIVKKSIDLHGGRIMVASEVGVGTTFKVKIPLNNRIATDEKDFSD